MFKLDLMSWILFCCIPMILHVWSYVILYFLPSCPVISCVLSLWSCSSTCFPKESWKEYIKDKYIAPGSTEMPVAAGAAQCFRANFGQAALSNFRRGNFLFFPPWMSLFGWLVDQWPETFALYIPHVSSFLKPTNGEIGTKLVPSFLPKAWHCPCLSSWHLWCKAFKPPLPKHGILWHHCANSAGGGSGFFRVPWPWWHTKHGPQMSTGGVFPPFSAHGVPPSKAIGLRDKRAPKGLVCWCVPRIHQEAACPRWRPRSQFSFSNQNKKVCITME